MRVLLTAALLALGLAGAAQAKEMPVPSGTIVKAPDWVTGSEWYYSDGYALKVTSISAQGTVFDRLDAPGQWFSRQGFIRKDSTSGTATRNAIYRTIPDAAGMSLTAGSPLTFNREYLSNGKLLVHASSWTLEGRETITVPAGTFDCYVIVWRTRSLKSDWNGFERWWYSPQAQNYVRLEFKYGPDANGSRVLMRYHLGPDPAAVAAAAPAPVVAAAPPAPAPAPVPAPQPVTVMPAPPVAAATVPAQAPQPVAVAPTPPVAAAPPAPIVPPAVPARAEAIEDRTEEKPVPPKAVKTAQAKPAPKPEAAAKNDMPKMDGPSAERPKGDGKVGSWHAQVGSSKDAAAMRASLNKTIADNPGMDALPSGIAAHNVAGRGTFYRAWLGSYDSAKDATALCRSLKTHGPGCTVFKNATVEAKAE